MERIRMLDTCESIADPEWSVLGNDTTNPGYSLAPAWGTRAIKFDKADGAANTVHAGMSRSLDSINLSKGVLPIDEIAWFLRVSAVTDIAYAWIRLGTDSSNYAEWRYDDSDLNTGGDFTLCHVPLYAADNTTGEVDFADLDYMAVGVAFDAETDTLTDIVVDHICILRPSAFASSGGSGGGGLLAVDMAKATASAPTHGEGDVTPLSVDLSGDLRSTITGAQAVDGATAPADSLQVGFLAGSTLPTAQTAGDLVAPLVDLYRRLWTKAFSTSSGADRAEIVNPSPIFTPGADAAITAAGSSSARNIDGYPNICYQVVVASLEAGQFVEVTPEASNDNTSWGRLHPDNDVYTITADDTYLFTFAGLAARWVRFTLVTDSVGGAVTLTPTLVAQKNG